MRKNNKGGSIINMASGQARDGFIYTPHYAASKFGVMGLTQSLAKRSSYCKISTLIQFALELLIPICGPIMTPNGEKY